MSAERSEVGLGEAFGRPELRIAWAVQAALVVVVVVVWGLVAGADDPRLDDRGIFVGMATAVVALAGVVMAVHRGPGRQDLGARILRTGFLLPAVLLVALAELPLLAIALIGDGDLVWVVVGSLIGLSLGGLGGSILVLFIAVGVMTWAAAPGGTSILARASGATLITSILVMAVGAAIGSRIEMEGSRGGFLSIIVALLGLKGDVRSAEWLWVARLAALVGILSLALMIRTFRKVPGFTTYMDPPARQREVD